MVHRLPAFALCWLGTMALWKGVLVLEGVLAPRWAVLVGLVEAGILAAAIAIVGLDGSPRRVVSVLAATSGLLGAVATLLFAAIGAGGDLLAFVLLTLYLASALFFAWGWRAELLVVAATIVPWLVATPSLVFHVPLIELVGAILTGSALAVAMAEDAARTFRAAFLHQAREERVKRALEASRDEAERARREAEAATRAKDEFLATLSHELRAPLNAVLSWTYMLRRRMLDTTETAHALEVIERNARAQLSLIADLLDVSRIVSGKLSMEMVRLDVRAVIGAVVDAVRAAVETKRLDLRVNVGRAAIPVRGDPTRLQQIVENILSNAIKFTPEGGRIDVIARTAGGNAEIIVRDTGVGIEPATLPRIFERFHQEDRGPARQLGGLGLGLAIARHLAELHGGTITAESEGEDRGAIFRVRLPLDRAGAIREGSSGEPASLPTLDGLRVLVVDDEPDARRSVASLLSRCGATVTPAASAAEALEALAERPADVLVADLAMPGEDGFSLVRKARVLERARGTHLRAIALTALAGPDDRQRAMSAGFDLHLAKPVDPSEVVAAVAGVTDDAA